MFRLQIRTLHFIYFVAATIFMEANFRLALSFMPVTNPAHSRNYLVQPNMLLYQSSPTSPRLSPGQLQELCSKGYVIVDNFLPESLLDSLRLDVQNLRKLNKFKVAKIGQDSTNTLDTSIRVTETYFLGRNKLNDTSNDSRSTLYEILNSIRIDLPQQPLDESLSEFLYAYYPSGGYYRRHRDAIPGSASALRQVSLLLYLNKDWTEQNGGQLRMHVDSGVDTLHFIDVAPRDGTLVLFNSHQIPHEVLDTLSERIAIVGWYNRPVNAGDIAILSHLEVSPVRVLGLAVAAGLFTVGLINILVD